MEDSHSLHITVSVGQKNSWGDFLGKVMQSVEMMCCVYVTYLLLVICSLHHINEQSFKY